MQLWLNHLQEVTTVQQLAQMYMFTEKKHKDRSQDYKNRYWSFQIKITINQKIVSF